MSSVGRTPRWTLWLPLGAAMAAGLMVGLAFTTTRAMSERNELALQGRLLGIGHEAEMRLRETGVDAAAGVLEELLEAGGGEVLGLQLRDSGGTAVAHEGDLNSPHVRSLDLFLGRFAAGGAATRHGGSRWSHGRGGRFELRLYLDPHAGTLPVAAKLLIPATTVVGAALVCFALLAGRFLMRQRQRIREAAERERLEALARAGAGLAHQLRTPLATIKGTSQLVAEEHHDPALATRLQRVIDQADRMDRLLGRLLDYARPPEPEPTLVSLAELIDECLERHPGATALVSPGAVAQVDREHLVEILDNLLSNALHFNPPGEPVTVSASSGPQGARIVVSDRGPGPGDDPERLFTPYVSSRSDGSGLGLPIARNLALANGGSLRLEQRAGGGCDAVLLLPTGEDAP